jgi:hypothetical protein
MEEQSPASAHRRVWLKELLSLSRDSKSVPVPLEPLDLDSLSGALELAEKRHPMASAPLRIAIALDINAMLRQRIRALGAMPPLDPARLGAALQAVETLQGRATAPADRIRAALAIYAAPGVG